MSEDTFFGTIAATALASSIAITAYHRIGARSAAIRAHPIGQCSNPHGGLAQEPALSEGWLRWLRPFGFIIWLAAIGHISNPHSMRWATIDLPDAVRWLGAGISLLSVPLIYWTLKNLGTNLSSGVIPLPYHVLVTSGPYRLVRHPWYSVLLVLLVGLTLLCASWVIGVMILVRGFYYSKRASIEEHALARTFGDAYRQYARSLPRFVPRIIA